MTFAKDVLNIVKHIPKGKVTTYKEIAHALGKQCYRAIGKALQTNNDAPDTPCHRVVKADGTIGGYFGEVEGDAILYKKHLLQEEGIEFEKNNKIKNFKDKLHRFS